MTEQIEVARNMADMERRLQRLETMETSSGGQFVGARFNSNSSQSIPNGVVTRINYEDQVYDTHGAVSVGTGTWTFTAPISGYYHITARYVYEHTTNWSEHNLGSLDLYIGGSKVATIGYETGLDSSATQAVKPIGGSSTNFISAGQEVWFTAYQNSGAALTFRPSNTVIFCTIERIGSVDTVSSTPVAARANTAAGQSVPNSTGFQLDYADIDYDTHGGITTGALWHYTIPVDGYYNLTASIMFQSSSAWIEQERIELFLVKNSVNFIVLTRDNGRNFSGGGDQVMVNGSCDHFFSAGDELWVKVNQRSGVTLNTIADGSYSYFTIHKIGDVNSRIAITSDMDYGCKIIRGNNQNIPHNVTTRIDLDTLRWNHNMEWSSTVNPDRIYIIKAGLYLVVDWSYWRNADTVGARRESVTNRWDSQAGAGGQVGSARHGPTTGFLRYMDTSMVLMNPGDYFYFDVHQDSGSTIAYQNRIFINMIAPGWTSGIN